MIGMHVHHDDRFRGDLAVEQGEPRVWTAPRTWVTNETLTSTLMNTQLRDQQLFLHDRGADLASAATITPTSQYHRVTGTVTITTIAAPTGSGQGGNRLLLEFLSAGCSITAGAGIILTGGGFTSVVNGTIEFVWDDVQAAWLEVDRSSGGGGLLAHAELTSSPSLFTATTEGGANAVLTLASVTFNGSTRIILIASITKIVVAASNSTFVWYEDSSAIGQEASVSGTVTLIVMARSLTPSAAAHVYSLRVYSNTSSGVTVTAGTGAAGQPKPSFLDASSAA